MLGAEVVAWHSGFDHGSEECRAFCRLVLDRPDLVVVSYHDEPDAALRESGVGGVLGAVVLGGTNELSPVDLGIQITESSGSPPPEIVTLREAERRHIDYVIRKTDGNKTEACRILDISRATLYAKLDDGSKK